MEITVVSYSLTGNNEALAARVARGLGAKHAKIVEPKPRAMGAIALDMLLNRTPKTDLPAEAFSESGFVLFFAPVWMGKVASPLRACLKKIKAEPRPYAFVSLSGGADGPNSNPSLASELKARTGAEPKAVIDLHIADLLPREPKPSREVTSAYRLTASDGEKLAATVLDALKGKVEF
jgi:hypothetical protein